MTSRKTVLLVDDDAQLLAAIREWMLSDGYDVVACSRFEDARAYLRSHAPDVLLSDVRLGAFNGLQLALYLSDAQPRTTMMLMSGYEDAVLRRDAKTCGAHFLLKPLDRGQLLARIRQAVEAASIQA
jgi:DNA-binding NtrC family response regulator